MKHNYKKFWNEFLQKNLDRNKKIMHWCDEFKIFSNKLWDILDERFSQWPVT